MTPTTEQWREYLTAGIQNICNHPSMFGPDPEGLVLTQVQSWNFVQGMEPRETIKRWRTHLAGEWKVGPQRLIDALTNSYWYDLNSTDNYYEIEHILGCAMASWARSEGLDVTDPTRHPERANTVP